MVYKSLNDLTPEQLRSKFTYRRDTSKYNLRYSVNKLAIPMSRTNYSTIVAQYFGIAYPLICGKQNL